MTSKLKAAEKDLESIRANQAEFVGKLEQAETDRAAVLEATEDGADLEELTKQIIELDGRAEILRAAIGKSKEQESIALGVVKRLQRQEAEKQFSARLAAVNAKVADIAALADSIDELRAEIIPEYESMEALAGQHFTGGKYNKLRSPYRGRILSARNAVVEFGQLANHIRGTAKPFVNGNK